MTLIGAFITLGSIVLAADTATVKLSTREPLAPTVKIEQTGPRSGAAMNGNYNWFGDMNADFEAVFRRVSADLRSERDVVPIAEQARRFGEALRREAEQQAKPGIDEMLRSRDGEVLTVTVVGFDGNQPVALGATVALDTAQPIPERIAFTVQYESFFPPSCIFFAGAIQAARALALNDSTAPVDVRTDPSVRRVQRKYRNCLQSINPDDATRFFEFAVEASIDQGAEFEISPGTIDWPIDVLVIPSSGTARLERIIAPSQLMQR
jgi:hypothetical protein